MFNRGKIKEMQERADRLADENLQLHRILREKVRQEEIASEFAIRDMLKRKVPIGKKIRYLEIDMICIDYDGKDIVFEYCKTNGDLTTKRLGVKLAETLLKD